MTTTLITGGTLVSATGTHDCDVLIAGERIIAVLERDGAASLGLTADLCIDATGKYVLPGGVDVHTHMELPTSGTVSSDTFETGTRAAAFGGTTTIVDFAQQNAGEDVMASLAAAHARADGNCAIDYAFHQVLGGVNDASLRDMRRLVDHEGITSFKLFMAYPGVLYSDDGAILQAMQTAAELGAMVMMHAENGIAIDVLRAQAVKRGDVGPAAHGDTRPVEMEAEATFRSIMLAKVAECPLYIVHMSAQEAVAAVATARDGGANVFGETCPQYLYLSYEEHLAQAGFEGAKYVCSTPLRRRADGHQDALWRYVRTNDLSVVATDHCPFCYTDQKTLGQGDFTKIPNGIGGVEHRMDLMYQGVVTGEITLTRWVELCATTPARMFGLYPRKGVIAPGSDADIVIYDPTATTTISAATHHMNLDYSAYEGFVVNGGVDMVLSRGEVVIDRGVYKGRTGHGRFVPRGLSSYLL